MIKSLSVLALTLSWLALADTPPPNTVKAKTYSGDGNTAITATGSALNVNISNTDFLNTVNQGLAGVDPWFVSVRNNAPLPVNACQETGGNLAGIFAELAGVIQISGPVALASPLPAGSNTIGKVDINGTIPVSVPSPVVVAQGAPGPTSSPWPVTLPNALPAGGNTIGAVTQGGVWTVNQGDPGDPWPVQVISLPSPVPVTQSGTWSIGITSLPSPVPISAAALPLPLGAATSAKQPALGTAGTPSADVLTVQGKVGMTPLLVDNSANVQPVVLASPIPTGANTIGAVNINGTVPVSIVSPLPVSGTVSISGTVPVSIPSPFPVVLASPLPTGGNVIGHVIVDALPSPVPVSQSGTWNVNSTSTVPTALTVHQAAITVGTSAVRMTYNGSAPASTRVLLVAQLLPASTAGCFFGSSGVTSSSTGRGVQMLAGQIFSFSRDAGDYYAICDTSSQTMLITEQE